jgi:hypothetical protein
VEKEGERHFYVVQKKMGRRVELVETEAVDLQGY